MSYFNTNIQYAGATELSKVIPSILHPPSHFILSHAHSHIHTRVSLPGLVCVYEVMLRGREDGVG